MRASSFLLYAVSGWFIAKTLVILLPPVASAAKGCCRIVAVLYYRVRAVKKFPDVVPVLRLKR